MSGDLSSSSLNEGHAQTLKSIQELQTMEKNLYTQLEYSSANGGNIDNESKIIKRINELSEMRIGLFKNLATKYKTIQNSVAETRVDLVDQMTVVGIVENELNNVKANLNNMETAKSDKMRMVEINTYYEQRYLAHTGVMKLVIMTSIPLLILAILSKKGFIPSTISTGLAILILVVGLILIINKVLDLRSRDNMYYEEIDWQFNPNTVRPTLYEYDKAQLEKLDIKADIKGIFGCINGDCCSEDMVYDEKANKCVDMVKNKDGFQVLGNDIAFPWGKNNTTIQSFNYDSNNNYASV